MLAVAADAQETYFRYMYKVTAGYFLELVQLHSNNILQGAVSIDVQGDSHNIQDSHHRLQ